MNNGTLLRTGTFWQKENERENEGGKDHLGDQRAAPGPVRVNSIGAFHDACAHKLADVDACLIETDHHATEMGWRNLCLIHGYKIGCEPYAHCEQIGQRLFWLEQRPPRSVSSLLPLKMRPI